MSEHSGHDDHAVSLAIRAVYDAQQEAVGIDAIASEAFDEGDDTRARIEVVAGIAARANCIAAEIIRQWDAPEERKRGLYDHFASLKESMLNDMLHRLDQGEELSPGQAEAGDESRPGGADGSTGEGGGGA